MLIKIDNSEWNVLGSYFGHIITFNKGSKMHELFNSNSIDNEYVMCSNGGMKLDGKIYVDIGFYSTIKCKECKTYLLSSPQYEVQEIQF